MVFVQRCLTSLSGIAWPPVAEGPVFDFIVPDELLAEAVSRSRDPGAIAALELVPGTGEGKPPPFLSAMCLPM